MDILDKARLVLQKPVCDRCLGRQFGQLLSSTDNRQRGELLRKAVAMGIDKEKLSDEDRRMDTGNFAGIVFHNLREAVPEGKKCSVCENIFEDTGMYADMIMKAAGKAEFSTFLVGTRLSSRLLENEESLWERAGIEWAEQIKAELNREIGRRVESEMKKRFNPKNPDIAFLVDAGRKKVTLKINPLFIYGEYQKLVRNIPQTKWPSGKYKTSVEEIIAKPFMRKTKGTAHVLHGLGREDIDARCLAWRPFVLEIKEPLLRSLKLKELQEAVNKGSRVKVRSLRLSSMDEVRKIKETRADKSYIAVVSCRNSIEKKLLKNISKLQSVISQRTPKRVMHRRADLRRRREVKKISARLLGKKQLELRITAEAGLYVKELISGDSGRTRPSLSEILQNECVCRQLDVSGIHLPKKVKK